ncbi:MAG: hypothetical protein MK135_13015, partial [Polyangiaceae bacterium]|nr:hypothetical protein [Polyangiaceae bacterium]
GEAPFFALFGALPLRRDHRREAFDDLKVAADYARFAGQCLIVFPSGRQQPAHFPAQFQRGALKVATLSGARTLPMALRYEFGENALPEVVIAFGKPLALGSDRESLAALEFAVAELSAQIDQWLLARIEKREPLVEPAQLFGGNQSRKVSLGERALRRLMMQ